MNKITLLSVLSVVTFSQVQVDISNLENTYVRGVNSILFFTSEDIISSGSYAFGNDNKTLDAHFLPLTHHFESDSDFYNFYVNGSIGYSKYEEKNIDIRSSLDEVDIKTYALKLGGGVRMNILEDTDMMIGGAYIYSKVNSDYLTSVPLDSSDRVDSDFDTVFNSSHHYNTLEFVTSLGYHPTINEYEPYIRGDVRYFDTKIDDKFASITDTSAVISKLKVGVMMPEVTAIVGLELRLEFYASEVFVGGDMDETIGEDNFYVLGTTFHLGTTTMNDWVSEVSFDMNIVRGDNLDGFNFGFGLSF